jgi:hypothetical protein
VLEALRRFIPELRKTTPAFSPQQHRAIWAITHCRTPALGGHAFACKSCHHVHFAYHSCNHKACPQCGARSKDQIIRGIYRHCISLKDRKHLSWPLSWQGRLQVWFRLNQQIEAGALDQMLRAVLTEVHPEMRVELFLERERPGLAPATEVFGYDPAEFPPQQQHV